MAITKSKTLPSGVSGNYWRILSILFDRQTLKATGTIGLFKDAAASAAGKPHIGLTKTFEFKFLVTDLTMPSDIIALVYSKIMTQAEATVSFDLAGNAITPRAFDQDIAGGVVA